MTKLIEQAEHCFRSDKLGVVVDQIQNVAIGMYYLPKSLSGSLDGFINVELKDSDIDAIYAKLFQDKRILYPQLALNGKWFDIGTPERLFVASAYVREKAGLNR